MLTFFHGWRRKMGVATLMMACVLLAGWVRSEYGFDAVRIALPGVFNFTVYSEFGQLDWHESCEQWRVPMRLYSTPHDAKYLAIREQLIGLTNDVPYAMIVTPLTLLSAYLLLSKSRPKPTPASQNHVDHS